MEYGIVGVLVFIAGVYAIANIVGSSATTGAKILWSLLVLILPVVGFIIWYFAGPRPASSAV